jgi:hypothetical protein
VIFKRKRTPEASPEGEPTEGRITPYPVPQESGNPFIWISKKNRRKWALSRGIHRRKF